MKHFLSAITALLVFLIPNLSHGQTYSLEGDWEGLLAVSGIELRIVFHVTKGDEGSLEATMDSPDQGAFGISCGEVKVDGVNVSIMVPQVGGKYEGTFSSQENIDGTWSQGMSSHNKGALQWHTSSRKCLIM